MSLLFIDSYDHYQTANVQQKYAVVETTAGAVEIVSGGRCDTQALQITMFPGHAGVVWGGSPVGDTFIAGFACKLTIGNSMPLFDLITGGTDQLRMFRTAEGGFSATHFPNAAFPPTAFTTGGGLLPFGIWTHIAFKIVMHPTSGSVTFAINGIEALTLTGVPTSTTQTSWTGLQLGGSAFTSQFLVDDLYISDADGAAPWNDLLGDVFVEYLRPIAPGSNTQWDLVGAPTNWEAVDDNNVPDTATGIETDVADEIDTYDYENLAEIPGTEVFGVQISTLCQKDQPGDRAIEPVTYDGSVAESGILLNVPLDTYQYRIGTMQANPATSAQWTVSEVNDQEHGIKLEI